MRLRVAQQRRRIGQGDRPRPVAGHRGKAPHLIVDAAPAVGLGKMGHHRHGDVAGSREHFACPGEVYRIQSQPIHSRIELEMDRQRRTPRCGVQQQI